jgi:hypothetical protein
MQDINNDVTRTLLRAASFAKDNRIPPAGFSRSHTSYDTVAIAGAAALDPNFCPGGAAVDTVTYSIASIPAQACTAQIALCYQSVRPSFTEHLATFATSAVSTFNGIWSAEPKGPFIMDTVLLLIEPKDPMSIISHTPAGGEQHVALSSDIVVTFSYGIDAGSLPGNFAAGGSTSGSIAGVFSVAGSEVTFNPNSDFAPDETVTVNLTTGISSAGGIGLARDSSWQFATVSIPSYTLIYTAGANGTLGGTTSQTVLQGANGTPVSAVPNVNYHFADWSDGTTANPRIDSNVTADISVAANFAIDTYTLTYTAGAGGTISGATSQVVDHGSNGTALTAIPDTGYHFVDWSDGNTANPRTDSSVTADVSVTANFAINTYTLTYSAGANGTISGTALQTVNYGASGISVTALPDAGYDFVQWSDGVTDNPRTDRNVTADISATASFQVSTSVLNQAIEMHPAGQFGLMAAPNPVRLNDGRINIILSTSSLCRRARLEIRDAVGNRVYNQVSYINGGDKHHFIWRLRNLSGRRVAPGTYRAIAVAENAQGEQKVFFTLIGIRQ